MNKLGHILPLALFFAVAGGEASATIKFDVSHTANKAQETVSEWAKQAQTAFEESTTIQTMIAYGKGVAEMAKWVKEQKALVDQTISDTVGAVNSVKDTATSTVSDIQGEVTGTVGDVTGAAGESVAGVAGGAAGAVSAAASKTKSAQELLQLKNERSSLESEYEAAAAARKTEFEGQIKSYQDNNARKEELETKIISNNETIRFLQEQFDKREAEEKAKSDALIAEVDAKIQNLRDVAAADSMGLATEAAGAFKSLFGNKQSAAELNKTIANNFIPENEDITSASIKKVRKYRNKTAANDVLTAYATALQVRINRYEKNEDAQETADSATMMDGATAAIAMDTQLKVKNMETLLVYTQMLIADMKMRSAMDLAKLTVYKLRDPSKDVTQFNLDDYKYKKPSKINKENILNLAKEAGSAAKDLNSSGVTGLLK